MMSVTVRILVYSIMLLLSLSSADPGGYHSSSGGYQSSSGGYHPSSGGYHPSSADHGGYHSSSDHHPGGRTVRRRVYTRVSYEEPRDDHVHVTHEVHHVLHNNRKKTRPVLVIREHDTLPVYPGSVNHGSVHPVSGFEGSYVAVSGEPGRGSVHVVENVPSLGSDSVTVVNGVRVRNSGVAYVPAEPSQIQGGILQVPAGSYVPTVHVPAGSYVPTVHVPAGSYVPTVHVPGAGSYAPTVHVPVAGSYVPSSVGGSFGSGVPPPVPHLATQGLFPSGPSRNFPPSPARESGVTGDRLPLPKCSYVNTDFPGDNFDPQTTDNLTGVNSGSARGCKSLCRLEDRCSFWTYREGFSRDTKARDCFLKTGTPGLPVPREAVPRIGFVSGTKDNNCICIKSEDEEDEVCPYKNPRGLVYPWRSTDQEEEDMAKGLLPTGWRRAGDPGLYPGPSDPYQPGSGGGLEDDIQALRAQLDVLSRRLDNE